MSESLVDTTLGQYHLIELIGRGGMAAVYKARQETLGRFVAVKVLSRHDDAEFAKRFRAEARATAHLQHPHILPIYDYGEQNGLFYLVLQYVEGSKTLDDLPSGPQPIPQVLLLISRLLTALEYAHGRGVVHRDIKPANVLLPTPDWPLLTDFGIAKLLDETGQRLTATGLVMGTPAYIAPEQAMGQPVDARTDLYAVGVMLYELLTGSLPFSADSAMGMLLKHVHEAPPAPRTLNSDLPAELEPVLLRALAKAPAERYGSARDMIGDLERAMAQLEPSYKMNRVASLYQSGVQAFEGRRWPDAIATFSQLQEIAPGYKDSADLLEAAQTVQRRTEERLSQQVQRAASNPSASERLAPPSPLATVALAPAAEEQARATASQRSVTPAPMAAPSRARQRALVAALVVLALLVGGVASALLFSQRSGAAVTPSATTGAQAPGATEAPPAPTVTAADAALAAATATVAPPPPAGAGVVSWGDQMLHSDAITLTLEDMPPLAAGRVYAAWLSNETSSLPLGPLAPSPDGRQTLSFAAPTHANLLSIFDRVYITQVPAAAATAEVANVVLVGSVPIEPLVHIRHVLFSFDTTPNKIGFGLGLLQETNEVIQHLDLLQKSLDRGDLAGEKVHLEHIVNIIEGQQGANFGDLNGDGKVQNPGDGFGILQNGSTNGYIAGMQSHAVLGAEAPNATPEMQRFAGGVQAAGENVRVRVEQIRDRALQINEATEAEATREDVAAIIELARAAMFGVDANNDGRIDPVPGEGGALVAYQQAQQMATITLVPGTLLAAAPPAPLPTVNVEGAPVAVVDNSYGPRKLTIAAGTIVVWTNNGPSAHTVSGEDKSFESGTMPSGGSFSHTFTEPGVYPYFCQFHGGPHGEGMAGTVIVNATP